MGLELESAGQTLAVGGLSLALLTLLLYADFPDRTGSFAKSAALISSASISFPIVRSAVVLALVYATGILVENYSRRAASGRGHLWFNDEWRDFISDDRSIRLRSLFDFDVYQPSPTSDNCDDAELQLTLTPIAAESLQLRAVKYLTRFQRESLQPAICAATRRPIDERAQFSVRGERDVNDFISAVNALYYLAKNLAYRHPPHLEELSKIESRYRFSGAFAFVGVAGVATGLPLTVITAVRFVIIHCRSDWLTPFPRRAFRDALTILLGVVIFSFLVARAGRASHIDDRRNFNLRVFGYLKAAQAANSLSSPRDRDRRRDEVVPEARTSVASGADDSP